MEVMLSVGELLGAGKWRAEHGKVALVAGAVHALRLGWRRADYHVREGHLAHAGWGSRGRDRR